MSAIHTADTASSLTPALVPMQYISTEERHPNIWHIEGATRTGLIRSENQDAYGISRNKGRRQYTVVCDGAGGHVGGREASQTATEIMTALLEDYAEQDINAVDLLLLAIAQTREVFKREKLEGITTAILVIFEDEYVHYATLGDGALVAVFPDGMTTQVQTPHHILGEPSNIIAAYIGQDCDVAPRVGCLRIEAGTTVMLMSDGASELFPYDDFAANHQPYIDYLMSNKMPPLTDHILGQIEEARDPETGAYLHHDNMTLIMAHYPKPPAHRPLVETLEDESNA